MRQHAARGNQSLAVASATASLHNLVGSDRWWIFYVTLFLTGLALGFILGAFALFQLFSYAIDFTGDQQLVLIYSP